MSISSITSSNINSNSFKKISSELEKYLSDTTKHSKKLENSLNNLLKATKDDDKIKKFDEFVSCYNKVISDNKNYADKGLQDLTKKLKNIFKNSSSELSDLGVDISSNGKIRFSTLKLSSSDSKKKDLVSFITKHSSSDGIFKKVLKIAHDLKKDNKSYLSTETVNLINAADNSRYINTYA